MIRYLLTVLIVPEYRTIKEMGLQQLRITKAVLQTMSLIHLVVLLKIHLRSKRSLPCQVKLVALSINILTMISLRPEPSFDK